MRGGFALADNTEARDACAAMERIVNEGGAEALRAHWTAFRSDIERHLER